MPRPIIAPIERLFINPPELDGSCGLNRAPINPADPVVNNDIDATRKFLSQFETTETTLRNYTKEVERLILWAILEKNRPLSSLTSSELSEFLDFLKDPQPVSVWGAIRKHPRESDDWRPFVAARRKGGKPASAGISAASRLTAFSILNSYFSWLVDYGYLIKNPLRQLKTKRKEIKLEDPKGFNDKVEHYLDEEMWAAFQDAIEQMPQHEKIESDYYERAKFISALMIYLAPRASELAKGKMSDFVRVNGKWWWNVVGKGKKAAQIPVVDGMVNALIRYRTYLGMSPLPLPDDHSPLLRSVRDGSGITTRQLNYILDDLFKKASDILLQKAAVQLKDIDRADYETRAAKILKASSHWGRHTSITFQIRSGEDKSIVQRNARHSDSRTTDGYTHEDKDFWHRESQKLRA